MDGEYRQKINIELTESEAECLLNWILYMKNNTADDSQQDVSEMLAMLFGRLIGAFPDLMESDSVTLFLEQYGPRSEGVPADKALIPRYRVLKHIEQELKTIRSYIKAELAKLDARETFIQGNCIRQVLGEDERYPTERMRFAEIWRRLGSDGNYNITKERKRKLKSELAKISDEIDTLSKSHQIDPAESALVF